MSDDMREQMTEATNSVIMLTTLLLSVLKDRSWLTWEESDRLVLRKFIGTLYKLSNNKLRPPFDAAIKDARKVGTLPESFGHIREPNQYEDDKRPGRVAKDDATKVAEALAELGLDD